MITRLTLDANEQGTYVVNAAFTDEDDASVVPDALTWSLFNAKGAVVNSRTDVVITPAASVDILLGAADLDMDNGHERYLLVEGTYTSTLGADLVINEQAYFPIEDLIGVT